MDPMQEKERNALRRRTADTLHALARKIENGTYEVVRIEIENELGESYEPTCPVIEHRPTGRQTIHVFYDTKTQADRR